MVLSLIIAVCILGLAAYIDSKEQIVPNWLSLGGMAIGIILSCFFPMIHEDTKWWLGGLSAIGDCFIVVVAMCWYALITEKILGYDTLGGGDIKIMGALATMVSWKITVLVMLISPLVGLINFAMERIKHEIQSMAYCPSIFIALLFSLLLAKFI